ncbi:hypothetical protein SPWS13_4542 [Shewanella putrefaciens]|nr:hypothetical protein SPWS13_4542 [Shewanella putrefaciens]
MNGLGFTEQYCQNGALLSTNHWRLGASVDFAEVNVRL